MNVTATPVQAYAERAAVFAAQVREHLSDLPADELDDLLDGLGADLTERLVDGGELGDARSYADELRQAAGLPPRDLSTEPALRVTFEERINAQQRKISEWFGSTPARSGFRDFALSLRPVWWIIRAALVIWPLLLIIGHPRFNGLPISLPAFLCFSALAIVSVQWGRGKWLPRNWLRHLRTLANVAAALLLVPFIAFTTNAFTSPMVDDAAYSEPFTSGLYTNGDQITNIFAYDCQGELLDGIRLYDQNGDPLKTTLDDPWGDTEDMPAEFWDEEQQRVVIMGFHPLAADAAEWNAYPLTQSEYNDVTGKPGEAEVASPRRDSVAPLVQECPAPDAEEEGSAETSVDAAAKDPAE
ncbi:MAG: hypothetical protein ACTIJ6_10685 [Leucobacter sp.]